MARAPEPTIMCPRVPARFATTLRCPLVLKAEFASDLTIVPAGIHGSNASEDFSAFADEGVPGVSSRSADTIRE